MCFLGIDKSCWVLIISNHAEISCSIAGIVMVIMKRVQSSFEVDFSFFDKEEHVLCEGEKYGRHTMTSGQN